MKKKKVIFIFVVIVALAFGFCVVRYHNINAIKTSFEKEAMQYEEKYLSTKSDVDLINLVCFLENAQVLDERRLEYTPILIDIISEDSIAKSELNDFYSQLNVDAPKAVPISFYIHDLLCFKKYDLFVDEFVKYYSNLSYNDREFVSSVVIETYKKLKTISIPEALVEGYSKVAKQSEDEVLINECLTKIVSLKDAVKYVKGETLSIDNEILRSMTVDGEHIPITVKGKVIKYYSVTTGDYINDVEKITQDDSSSVPND